MRGYMSVLALGARSTMYKAAALLAVTAAAETALFLRAMSLAEATADLEFLLNKSGVLQVSAVSFLILCAILSTVGITRSGSQVGYTLRRLSIQEEKVAIAWGLYNMCCIAVFWAVQLLVALFLCGLYAEGLDSDLRSTQMIFLQFYTVPFLHSLMPLEEISRWVRNLAIIVGLGVSTGYFSLKLRRGKKPLAAPVLAVLGVLNFSYGLGATEADLMLTALAAIVTIYSLYDIWGGASYEE